MARVGLEASPPVPAPAPLRPFLSFRRLSGRALDRARRVLDEDEVFRERVHDAVDRDEVGEAGWLLLDRPDGWEERLAELLTDASRQAAEAGSTEEVARLERELTRALAERDEAMAAARTARSEQDRAARAVDDARAGREAAEQRHADLESELDELREQRNEAVRDLKALEVRANARLDDLRAAQADLASARREVAELQDTAGEDDEQAAEPEPSAGAVDGGAVDSAAAPDVVVGPTSGVDHDALAALVDRAAAAAGELSAALGEAAALVRPAPGTPAVPSGPDPLPPTTVDPAPVEERPARREPVAIPVGVFDDTPEAALHLFRHPGTTLAVDGYNVSLAGWPTLALAAQRHRLVDALEALAARTGCHVVVVFDGADVGRGLPGESRPRGVQVRFTAPGVEADDELLALLDALPVTRPVTVASSDRRVADGARRRGATVVSGPQLLAVLDA